MKKFQYAINAIRDEIHRHVGKVAEKAVEHKHDPTIALRLSKARNLKRAIEILEQHPENKSV